jgi:hypothetical protein
MTDTERAAVATALAHLKTAHGALADTIDSLTAASDDVWEQARKAGRLAQEVDTIIEALTQR